MENLNFNTWGERDDWEAPLWSLDVPGRDGQPPRALILDADPALCRQVGLALRSLGIHSDTFCDAREALHSAREHTYAVAVVDVGLEQGFEVCRRLTRGDRARRIPVLAFACNASFLDRLKARRYGCQQFVTKPAPLERFLRAVWRTATGGRPLRDSAVPAQHLPSSA